MRREAGDRPFLGGCRQPVRGLALRLGGLVEAGLAVLAVLAALGCSGRGAGPVPALALHPRGNEEAVVAAGEALPIFLYKQPPGKFQLCVTVPPAKATQQPDWEGRLTGAVRGLLPEDYAPPSLTMAGTLCFQGALRGLPRRGEEVEICLDVRDRYTGGRVGKGCQRLAFAPHKAIREKQMEEAGRLYAARNLGAIDGAAARAAREGYPFFGELLRLMAVTLCREEKTAASLAEARRRLAELPAWLDSPAASELAAAREFESGLLELEAGGTIKEAWSHFKLAETLYLRIASPMRHATIAKLSGILSDSGGANEAEEKLRGALRACTGKTCDAYMLPYSQGDLAWLILVNPEADGAALREGEALARTAIDELRRRGETREEANQWLNLAFLALRQKRDPDEALRRASSLLSGPGVDAGEVAPLRQWADLARARQALLAGDLARALAICGGLEGRHSRLITAWALSCTGEAQRRRGRLDQALAVFERALAFYQYANPATAGQRIPLGPGQRADVYYLAALTAVELGELAKAWSFLEELDSLLASEEDARRCTPAAWSQALDRQREQLLAQILALETPTSPERRQQLEESLAKIKEQLQEASRQLPSCARPVGRAATSSGPDFRAVPLPDEVLLLERSATGRVSLARRTRLERQAIYALVDWAAGALDEPGQGAVSDGEWRRRLLPLAEALVPSGRRFQATTVFALHGALQGTPLAALPVPGEGGRWLSELTTPAVHPAIPAIPPPAPEPVADPFSSPLFVVNPTGDLGWGERLLPVYRASFPQAVVLAREAATPQAFRRLVATATLLHVDAHGDYDAAFPELSRIRLAGGSLLLGDLAAQASLPRGFVNLSGCKTGRWPVTADSGQYGLAGLFARRGAAWVVASRGDLDDRVAHAFNRAFYGGVAPGAGFAGRYARALAALRGEGIPAAEWAGLLLLRGAPPEARAKEPAGDS